MAPLVLAAAAAQASIVVAQPGEKIMAYEALVKGALDRALDCLH